MAVRQSLARLALVTALLVPATARADAYAWGGQSGPLSVDVTLLGFRDGAGEGGWEVEDARALAAWGARFGALSSEFDVALTYGPDTDETTIVLTEHGAPSSPRTTVFGGEPDLEAAYAWVARAVGASPDGAFVESPSVFTIQLLATKSRERADRYADMLERAGVAPKHSFFYENCLPCSVHELHVLDLGDGWFRVVTGIFDSPARARQSLRELRAAGLVSASFVRRL
ncbi:MAG: SPOR domain-containing protein [Polyangiaceae bacterium]